MSFEPPRPPSPLSPAPPSFLGPFGVDFSTIIFLPYKSLPLYSKAALSDPSSSNFTKAIPFDLPSCPFNKLTLLIDPHSEKKSLMSYSVALYERLPTKISYSPLYFCGFSSSSSEPSSELAFLFPTNGFCCGLPFFCGLASSSDSSSSLSESLFYVTFLDG